MPKITTRNGTPICGAASPAPFSAFIVSRRSTSSASSSARRHALDRRRAVPQPRVAHAKDVADHDGGCSGFGGGGCSGGSGGIASASGASARDELVEQRTHLVHADIQGRDEPLHRDRLGAVAAPGRVVDDHADRDIRQPQLARQRGFGHAGHADHRRAVAVHAVDLAGRFQPRTLAPRRRCRRRSPQRRQLSPLRGSCLAAPACTGA